MQQSLKAGVFLCSAEFVNKTQKRWYSKLFGVSLIMFEQT